MKAACAGFFVGLVVCAGVAVAQPETTQAPLPSWRDGKARSAIVDFVPGVSDATSPAFVPVAERIATFDNDGTLWSEQPLYFQALFALDRVQAMSADHPEWRNTEPFKNALAGDMKGLLAGGQEGVMKVLLTAHANMTADAFAQSVRSWLATAKHPTTGVPFTAMVYQPMLELLDYLRANGFKTFIVSGGGVDFMRVFSERVYGIPPEQVIGSHGQVKFELRDGQPVLVKTLDTLFVDDKEGKPVGIHQFIGRRPIAAFGNSDGDKAMLEYTTIGNPRPSFGLIVHHTDSDREYAYDAHPKSSGKLVEALADAPKRGWTVVDMQQDWATVLAP